MHSKHVPKALPFNIPILFANMTWPEQQTRHVLGIRDVDHPPSLNMGTQFHDLPKDDQFHARWDDPGLFRAMERLQVNFGDLCLQYGGRDSTGVTWIKFYEGDHDKPNGLGNLKFVLFLHDWDDLAIEGTLEDLDWEITYPDEEGAAVKADPAGLVQGSSEVKTEHEEKKGDIADVVIDVKEEDVTGVVGDFLSAAKVEEDHQKAKEEMGDEDSEVAIKQEPDQERDLDME